MQSVDDTRPYRILIVDDIENNRFTLDLMLSLLGEFDIHEAESGAEALQKINETTFDLVLLDIMMPGMTGIEVLQTLDLSTSKLPTKFIVVSALQDMETIVSALELGALDYLPKPIEEALLAARLTQLLERRETDILLSEHRARIDADLKNAAEIQQSLCPGQPLSLSCTVVGYELAGTMVPAYEVGGDFFDYFMQRNGNIVIVIADACGKGAPAAIYGTRVHDLLRMDSLHQSDAVMSDPAQSLLSMLNAVSAVLFENNDKCWFVTAWVGVLSTETLSLHWCSAGHCEPLLQQPNGSVQIMSSEVGLPLGLEEAFSAPVTSTTLKPGSIVHFYTDGITEHRTDTGEFVGISGLIDLITQVSAPEMRPQEITRAVAASVLGLNQQQSPEDDVTMLSLVVKSIVE